MQVKSLVMDEAAMERSLGRIAHEIVEKNKGCNQLYLIGIQSRGVPLAHKIADYIQRYEQTEIPVGTLNITGYRDDRPHEKTEPIHRETYIPFDVTDKNVVLVDDVLYTGRTARAAIEAVMKLGRPACIRLAILIDRGHRELPIRGDFVGKNIPTSQNELIQVSIPPFDDECSVKLYGKEQE